MNKWTEPEDIIEILRKKWRSGRILKDLFAPDDLYPIRIRIQGPSASEIGDQFSEVSKWIIRLQEKSKTGIGYGYQLNVKEQNYKQIGRNSMPAYALIETSEDALKLLKRTKDADEFKALVTSLMSSFPAASEDLHMWVEKYPHKALAVYPDHEKIFAVVNWFLENPDSRLYLRQLDIEGIDTKFIEQRKPILSELLDLILPADTVRPDAKKFEDRYGLRAKPPMIRFRFLADSSFLKGLSDIQTPAEQFRNLNPDVKTVYITENEINGLSFPDVPDALVIFGLGYGVDLLKTIHWLRDKEIIYWGDIDTHGFAMLNQVRSFLPQAQSILMNRLILLRYKSLWSKEEKQFQGHLEHLNIEETSVYELLRNNTLSAGVRLEQERIPFSELLLILRSR